MGAAIGVVAGVIAFLLHRRAGFWTDYVFPWEAARQLLAGRDPYQALAGGGAEPFTTPLLYPLPTVLAAVPVAHLPLHLASAVTMAVSAALLAFALTRKGWDHLWALAGAPFAMAVNLGQWSPLVTVAAILPSAGFLAILKPNIGLAIAVYRPTLRMAVGSAAVLLLSIAVLPAWPLEWLQAIRSLPGHPAPIASAHGVGLLLALALLRWRTPEGRLLIAMSCIPQLMFFADQLPLLLVARSKRETQALGFSSLIGFLGWFATVSRTEAYVPAAEPFVLAFVYLPALAMVLRRPNVVDPEDATEITEPARSA